MFGLGARLAVYIGRWLERLQEARPSRLLFASALTVGCTALLVAAVLVGATERANLLVIGQQHTMMMHAVVGAVDQVPYYQQSIAGWDDAVRKVHDRYDPEWVRKNFGSWLSEYYKYDRTYLLNAQNSVLFAFVDGKQVLVPLDLDPAIMHLVEQLRGTLAAGSLEAFEPGKTHIPRVYDTVTIDGRPTVVSVMPIVPSTPEVAQVRGTECLVLSLRYLDGAFAEHLAESHRLSGARFARQDDTGANEASYAVTNAAGQAVGYLIWTPPYPGWEILKGVLPVLAFGLFSVGLTVTFLIATLRRLHSQLHASEGHARHLAHHDALTGLPNRAFFDERLAAAMEKPEAQRPALLFLDLDHFKQVNDTLGHPAGDELIKQFVSRLRQIVGPDEFLARTGGDEFAIIVTNHPGPALIDKLCDDILGSVVAPFLVRKTQACVGISIGVAVSGTDDDASDLARKADIALYQAKYSGRRRSEVFSSEMSDKLREKQLMEVELRSALQTGAGLEVVYQPVYATGGTKLKGVEALARWNNARLGSIPPPVFVALAEECGLIETLGSWVLREACTVAQITGVETLAVNVSPAQFLNPNFAATVFATLAETGLPANRLEIEITETTLIDEAGHATSAVRALRAGGVRIALDDFGTGYSSLSYLIKHEVDRVKIDRSFISLICEGAPATSIVLAIIAMAHAMGIAVTAEGVETQEQLALLGFLGCDDVQGYLLSKPLPAAQLASLAIAA